MVFPGRFSTGCMRCRQRKVKCDEAKPSCRRCYIYGKPCPGYTDQFHFRHGSTNSKSTSPGSKAVKIELQTGNDKPAPASRESTDNAQQQQQQQQSQQSQQQVTRARRQCPTIKPHPQVSYDHVSLCYFVQRFVSADGADSFPGHLTFLPDLYNHQDQGLLEQATLSVAQMAAYNQFGGDKFRLMSYRNYGSAIRALQETLKSQDMVTDDKVVTAVLLLCAFKDISGEGSGDPNEHASGLYYLLDRRGVEQLATRRGVELFLLALIRLQVYSFLHEDDAYSDPGGIAAFIGLFDPLLRAMSMMSKTLRLRHALSKCGPTSSGDQLSFQSDSSPYGSPYGRLTNQEDEDDAPLVQSCFETLEEFDTWDANAESFWKQTFERRAVPTALGAIARSASYYDPETACTIILVRSARLILLLSLLEYHGRMQVFTNGEYANTGHGAAWAGCIPALERDVRSTIDDVFASAPYALGDVDPSGRPATMAHDGAGALVILQPIRLVTHCYYATPEQVQTGQHILNRINGSIGIRSAVPKEETGFTSRWIESQGFLSAMAVTTTPEENHTAPLPALST